jgi:hypothetical protein
MITMTKSACFLAIGICLCSQSTKSVAAAERDDGLPWKAACMGPFKHNNAQIAPEPPQDHAEVLKRYAEGNAVERSLFAKTVIAKEYVEAHLIQLAKEDQKLQNELPGALGRTNANTVLNSLIGRKPIWRDLLKGDGDGGFVDTVDQLRVKKLKIEESNIYRNLLNVSIADQAEAHLRKALKDRALPDYARLLSTGTSARSGSATPASNR